MSGTMSEELRSNIKSAFKDVGLTNVGNDILNQCISLASTLHVSPKQMAECWEAFSLNKDLSDLDGHSFPTYRLALIKDSDNSATDLTTDFSGKAINSRPSLGSKRMINETENLPSVTPPSKRSGNNSFDPSRSAVDSIASNRRVSLSPAPPASLMKSSQRSSNLPKYEERSGAGKVIHTFNPNELQWAEVANTTSPKCTISSSLFETNVQEPYRHMFTTLDERAKALDEHLVELGDAIIERYDLGTKDDAGDETTNETQIAPLEAVGIPRQDKICCVGRICNSAHQGRINATSVLLEGSRHTSGGARMEVDLSHLKKNKMDYSLFPGQIVAVEGMNTSGRKLVADRICEGAAHQPQTSSVKELLRFHHDDAFQGGAPLKIMATCGPYTTSDNTNYQPLLDLVTTVQEEKPDVVILSGPFVDMRHKTVRSGETALEFSDGGDEAFVSFDTFFANKVSIMLEELFSASDDLQTQFVLLPSLQDAMAEWVYPQPPLKDRLAGGGKNLNVPGAEGIEIGTLGLSHIETAGGGALENQKGKHSSAAHRRVHCVSNPCTLKINELVVGVTSTDVLFQMSADETNANLVPGSRLGRISQHMLQQRSYYPMFPAAPGTNINLKKMNKWKMPSQPDILIIPSKLTSFARTVLDSTVVVNPGHLCRDTTGGTYAIMEVHPIKRDKLENAGSEDVQMQHGVNERTRVEIKRI